MSVILPIERDTRLRDLDAAAGQTVFTFDAPLTDVADLSVYSRAATATVWTAVAAGITKTLLDDDAGCTVTFATAPRPTSGDTAVTIRLKGARTHERITDVTRGGAIRSAALEREFDLLGMVAQELRRDVDDLEGRVVAGETILAAEAAAEAARDDAEAAAAAALTATAIYETRAAVVAATVSAGVRVLQTRSYAAAGDGGGWDHVIRVDAEPSHALKVRSLDRYLPNGTTSASNGGWWEYVPPAGPVPARKFGAVGGANFLAKTGPDDTAAFVAAKAYAEATGRAILVDDYYNLLSMSATGLVVDGWRLLGIGETACGLRVKVGAADKVGTYAQSGTTVTVTIAGHGKSTGALVYFEPTSGAGVAGWFVATVTGVNTFTLAAAASATTSGACRLIEFPLHARGISLVGTDAEVADFELATHQWSQRPEDRGDWGANIGIGFFGYGATQALVLRPRVRNIRLTRSPSTSGDPSYEGVGVIVVGNVEGYSVRDISFDDASAVGFSYGVSQHWGCSALDPLGPPGETYHPHDGEWTFAGPLKGAKIGVGLSSCYNVRIGDFDATGCRQSLYMLPGDNADAYAVARDAGRVMRGIRYGFVTGRLTGAASGQHGIEIQGQSQSKFETVDGLPRLRNLDLDIVGQGYDLAYDGVCPASTDAVYVANHCGRVDLGPGKSSGYSRRALYVYQSAMESDTLWDITESDQGIYVTGGGVFDGRNNNVAPAWDDADSGGVTILGATLSGTLASTSAAGATTSTLTAALGAPLFPGDSIAIGTNTARVTAPVAAAGVTIEHSALMASAAGGAAVTVEKRPRGRLQPNTKKGRYGGRFNACSVALWGAGPTNSGQYGIRVEAGAVVTMAGAWPKDTGKDATTPTNYDVAVFAGGHLSASGAHIAAGAASLEAHVWGETGSSIDIVDAVKAGSTTFYSGPLAALSVGRMVDTAGAPIDLFRGTDANGEWVAHQDGTLQCWGRNVSITSGDLTWTFPGVGGPTSGPALPVQFLSTAGIAVTVTPTSSSTPYIARALSASATTVAISTWNTSSAKTTAGVNIHAIGRWRN